MSIKLQRFDLFEMRIFFKTITDSFFCSYCFHRETRINVLFFLQPSVQGVSSLEKVENLWRRRESEKASSPCKQWPLVDNQMQSDWSKKNHYRLSQKGAMTIWCTRWQCCITVKQCREWMKTVLQIKLLQKLQLRLCLFVCLFVWSFSGSFQLMNHVTH